jgi:hypothetical protein
VPAELAGKFTAAKLSFSGEPRPGWLVTVLGRLVPALGFLLVGDRRSMFNRG